MTTDTGYAGTRGKADLGRRFAAYFIDGLVAYIPALIVSFLFALGGFRGAGLGLGLIAGGAYILLRDGLNLDFADGRSIGKKLMKLRAQRLDGGPMTMEASVRRNWPLGAFYVLYGLGALFGGLGVYSIAGLFGIIGWAASLLTIVEAVLVLTDKEGRRLGDKMAETQVFDTGE
jgi:uncharacterized RDD family membrane protein YckC